MAYAYGFNWREDNRLGRLKELLIQGNTVIECSEILSKEWKVKINYTQIETAKKRYKLMRYLLEKDFKAKIYTRMTIPEGNYMISCDHHSPYHSELYINRKLAIADKFRIKKDIEIGDVFDFDFMKKHPLQEGEKTHSIKREIVGTEPVIKSLEYFDKVYIIRGNHEWRISRFTDSRLQAEHVMKIFGLDIYDKKFKYCVADNAFIGKKWMAVHPDSYSQISTSVAKRLAEKFHRNILNSHGHLVGMAYDRSGEYLVYDLGCMLDKKKIGYINLQTTSHPVWKNGFGMFYNGHFYHFNDETDWSYWIGEK